MARKEATRSSRRRLGRGLDSLISTPVAVDVADETPAERPASEPADGLERIPVEDIHPNPSQPRQYFDETALTALGESIRVAGLMQPIVVRPRPESGFELIAGERRWRAARSIGMEQIPAVVRIIDDETAAEWALIENLQREDLNAMERAEAFRHLADEFKLSQQEIAERVGLNRASVANHLRLLDLDEAIQNAVREKQLGMGHARALLAISKADDRRRLAEQATLEGWSVRELERRVREHAEAKRAAGGGGGGSKALTPAEANRRDLEEKLGAHLGTRVHIKAGRKKGTGSMEIEYYDLDHFEGLLRTMGIRSD